MAKKSLRLGMLALVMVLGIFLSGCSTTTPVFYSNNSNYEFEILGEVKYDSSMIFPGTQKNGFTALLAAAKKQYPDCDYVIDVMVDHKLTRLLFVFTFENFTMRGTAIKYIKGTSKNRTFK